jgi:hypothetical protein
LFAPSASTRTERRKSSTSIGLSPAARAGYGCTSTWLTRACHFLDAASLLPPPARALLVSADEHQQLHGRDVCLYGIVADLVCGLDGITADGIS